MIDPADVAHLTQAMDELLLPEIYTFCADVKGMEMQAREPYEHQLLIEGMIA